MSKNSAANWTDYMSQWADHYMAPKKKRAPEGAEGEVEDTPAAQPKAAARKDPRAAAKKETNLVSRIEAKTKHHEVIQLCEGRVEQMSTHHLVAALFKIASTATMKAREACLSDKTVVSIASKLRLSLRNAKLASVNLPAKAASEGLYALAKMDMLHKDREAVAGAAAACERADIKLWDSKSMTKLVYGMARSGFAAHFKPLITSVVREIEPRTRELEMDSLLECMWGITKGTVHTLTETKGVMIRTETAEENLFRAVAERAILHATSLEPRQMSDIVHNFAQIGMKHERLFKCLGDRILKKQDKMTDEQMLKAVKAYQRFGIPLRDAPQGFKDTAIVAKGDFLRPSDKPPPKKFRYDRPPPIAFGSDGITTKNQGKCGA